METFTQSSLVAFAECPEKHRLSYIEGGNGIKPRVVDLKMAAGTEMHKAVFALHRGIRPTDVEQYIRIGFAVFKKSYNHSPQTLQDIEVAAECTIGAMYGYKKQWLSRPMKLQFDKENIPIDFDMEVHGEICRFNGEIDWMGNKNGHPVLVEVKNTADISQKFKFDVEMSPQTLLYIIGYYEQYAKKNEVVLTLFDYIRKPSIRPQKGESLQQYMRRVREDYIGRPEFYFHRAYIRREAKDLLRFKQELIALVRTHRFVSRRNLWYKNRKACNARGRCQFFDICAFGQTPGIMANFERKKMQHEELAKHVTTHEEE